MCCDSTATPPLASPKVFLMSPPKAITCGCDAPNPSGNGSGRGARPRPLRRGAAAGDLNEAVIHPVCYVAIVHQEQVGEIRQPVAGLGICRHLRIATGIAGGHHQRNIDGLHQHRVQR